jgi:hypothetical protein
MNKVTYFNEINIQPDIQKSLIVRACSCLDDILDYEVHKVILENADELSKYSFKNTDMTEFIKERVC